jgi:drug/metabolite transporter (DMT)-like permease
MGWLVWKHRVSRVFLVGMVMAIVGMFVLVGPNFALGGLPSRVMLLARAHRHLLRKLHARDQGRARRGASTARIMAWSTTIPAIALLPFAVLSPQPFLPSSTEGWLVVIGLALITQILGQGLIAYAFAHLPASLSSVSLLIQPVMAALFAWILFGEAIGAAQFAGGIIVLAGIWIARRGSN